MTVTRSHGTLHASNTYVLITTHCCQSKHNINHGRTWLYYRSRTYVLLTITHVIDRDLYHVCSYYFNLRTHYYHILLCFICTLYNTRQIYTIINKTYKIPCIYYLLTHWTCWKHARNISPAVKMYIYRYKEHCTRHTDPS